MRIPSGVTDQYIYFVAVDDTDGVTRETGLSGFTVYRSRNGAAAAAMTTPTVNETDSSNMPGVYELLLDEDMTIAAGNDSEEMVFHITVTGMRPVTRVIELYRPKITAGQTLTVASGIGEASVEQWKGTVPANLNGSQYVQVDLATWRGVAPAVLSGSRVSAQLDSTGLDATAAAEIADAVLDEALSGHTTAGSLGKAIADIEVDTAEIGAAGAGLTAINLPDQTMNITGNITGNLSGSVGSVTGAINTAAGTITTLDGLDTAQDVQHAQTQSDIAGLSIPSAGVIADAVLDEALSGHVTAGTLGKAVADIESDVTAILVDTGTTLPAALATTDGKVDDVKAKTDSLTFTVPGQVDTNIKYVADVEVAGVGTEASPWGPA